MARPKGSKNKVTMTVAATVDYAALIDEKQSAKDALNAEITSIAANIDTLKANMKSKKAEIKKLDKAIAHLAEKKDEADKKAAAEVNRKKAEELVANALANGMTAEDIAKLLK